MEKRKWKQNQTYLKLILYMGCVWVVDDLFVIWLFLLFLSIHQKEENFELSTRSLTLCPWKSCAVETRGSPWSVHRPRITNWPTVPSWTHTNAHCSNSVQIHVWRHIIDTSYVNNTYFGKLRPTFFFYRVLTHSFSVW